jgi:hypothetical protein
MWPSYLDATSMPLCYQVQGKHDYNDMLRVSDAHHNSQYVVIIHPLSIHVILLFGLIHGGFNETLSNWI